MQEQVKLLCGKTLTPEPHASPPCPMPMSCEESYLDLNPIMPHAPPRCPAQLSCEEPYLDLNPEPHAPPRCPAVPRGVLLGLAPGCLGTPQPGPRICRVAGGAHDAAARGQADRCVGEGYYNVTQCNTDLQHIAIYTVIQ